jgi:hypothetical protein
MLNELDLIRVWNDKFILKSVIHQDSPGWDELEEIFYERWNVELSELDGFSGVWGFEHNVFYEVVNVDNYQTEYIIQGNKFLGDKWSCYYDSEEEMEENEDMNQNGEETWVRVGIDRNGGEFVTYSDKPELLV